MKDAAKFYSDIALAFSAYINCEKTNNDKQIGYLESRIESLVKQYLPHGSGFDNGVKFNWHDSNINKLCFDTAFHHMDTHGYYDGWTEHTVIIRPCLMFGFDIKVTGRNRNDIKELISSAFSDFEYNEV